MNEGCNILNSWQVYCSLNHLLNECMMSLPESMNQRVSVTEWTLLVTNSGKSEITAKLSFYSCPSAIQWASTISTTWQCACRWMSLKFCDCFPHSMGVSKSHTLNERHLIRRHFKDSTLNTLFFFFCVKKGYVELLRLLAMEIRARFYGTTCHFRLAICFEQ